MSDVEEKIAILNRGYEILWEPHGCSMYPFIREGRDRVVLRKKSDVGEWDIVLVRIAEDYALLRVVDIHQNALLLMGDGTPDVVQRCTRDDVLGTVVGILRGKKTLRPKKGLLWRMLYPIRRLLYDRHTAMNDSAYEQ